MNPPFTLDEAALTKRMSSLITESRTLFDHSHAIGCIPLPSAAAAGSFIATAAQWRDKVSRLASTHAENLRESAEHFVAFARTAGSQEARNTAAFQTGSKP